MVIYISEFLKFFRDKFKKILLVTLILTVIFLFLFRSLSSTRTPGEIESDEQINESTPLVSQVMPAHFQFFIEYEDDDTYTNNLLIEQYLLTEEVLREASQEIEIDLIEIIKNSNNEIEVNYKETGLSKVIGVVRNDSNHLMELSVDVGDEKNNLKIAQYYYEYILNDNIPFLTDKEIYIFKEPTIRDIDSLDSAILSEEISVNNEESIIKDLIISGVMGLLFTVLFFFVKTFFSEKLVYAFSYLLEDKDVFLLIDEDNLDELSMILSTPESSNIIIIRENKRRSSLELDNIYTKIFYENSVQEVENIIEIKEDSNIERLIYLIEEGETSRDWYNKQRRLDGLTNIPTYVVQLNKGKYH